MTGVTTIIQDGENHEAYVGGDRVGVLQQNGEKLAINFLVAGTFQWQEAKSFVEALAKLVVVGDTILGGADLASLVTKIEDSEMASKKKLVDAKKAARDAMHAHGKAVKAEKATAAAKPVKVKEVAAKTDKEPRTRGDTAGAMFQELIMAGKLKDDDIFAKVKEKYGLDDKKRSYVAWYRNKLKKDGKNPPESRE